MLLTEFKHLRAKKQVQLLTIISEIFFNLPFSQKTTVTGASRASFKSFGQ